MMHITASSAGQAFAEVYCNPGETVIDIGGRDVNGSLRPVFESREIRFVCVDIECHASVDIVTMPGDKLPFETGSVDAIVSTSCFEHDPCFWITFKEMCRVCKPGGYIYVNAPAYGKYHKHPGDNWRFFSDAAQALAHWSALKYSVDEDDGEYPVVVHETFLIDPLSGEDANSAWTDFVGVWRRVPKSEIVKEIVVSDAMRAAKGPLETKLNCMGYVTRLQTEV